MYASMVTRIRVTASENALTPHSRRNIGLRRMRRTIIPRAARSPISSPFLSDICALSDEPRAADRGPRTVVSRGDYWIYANLPGPYHERHDAPLLGFTIPQRARCPVQSARPVRVNIGRKVRRWLVSGGR